MWHGQKLYDGGESFETCAGTSESRFERYDENSQGAQGTADLCGILWLAFGGYKK